MIILDVWGGEFSQDHVARYVSPVEEAMSLAKHELNAGFLVNMRNEVSWGGVVPFDERLGNND